MKNNRGLTTLEFCVLIAVVVAGLLAMRPYFKQAVQGNWRGNADSFSDGQYEEGLTREYVSPLTFESTMQAQENSTAPNTPWEFLAKKESGGEILHIDEWGTYYDGREHKAE